ncbi:isochorismatase family protein [Mesorhizobium sp. M1C.F.Ca.ET.193.01.1.1]|uniref:cysteine hydrolase family protein n=4 Tax=Mesorhizobium TaxID=68287 RepID=UPI000FD1FBEB|nr:MULTISPECIES: cysteine hydrolase [unclassified Mesorhizobium]TGS91190.1 isochorismatase family protein [bacterium M00.F.Ca.ET.177.01.1.1]TGQ49679.1 isochorismatase family protein [Mesorhizobium sp. M1C.F.Ca.ET.210.01.1.1]TGQ63916.1 isochorismatase family protein [Mesorhizobium sp. M1C.F.Ca.ET.212.01.1.1]TGR17641.1 isochorismatase family protein [Mesorhizobium sp. M1C.F.Ca.ET.196.01.1.1]TGR39734.1 isochorismatase family protein [Mesorhizobium sp. M1C.F.Ca.ET.195.01.1.1]
MYPLVIDAKPQPISVDPANAAVLVVDMQNDFGSKGGMFDRAGIDISGIQRAVGPTARVIAAARDLRMPVVYLKMGYSSDLSDLGTSDAPNRIRHLQIFRVGDSMTAPDGSECRILIRDTWGTDIVSDLKPEAEDVVLYKTRFSGFYDTELDTVLKNADIKYLVVTGCTTSVCVESTIRDAFFRDYHCILLTDCTSEPIASDASRSNHDASITLVQILFGWTSTADHFLKAIEERVHERVELAE